MVSEDRSSPKPPHSSAKSSSPLLEELKKSDVDSKEGERVEWSREDFCFVSVIPGLERGDGAEGGGFVEPRVGTEEGRC